MSSQPAGLGRPLQTVSLRRRVTIWTLLLLIVVLTTLGLVVNWLLGDALRSDLRQRLEDKASYAAVLQEQGVTGQALADRLVGGGVFSSFSSGDHQFIGRDSGAPPQRPAGGPGQRPARPMPAAKPTVSFSEVSGRLTATVDLRDGTLVLSTNESEIATTLTRLRQIELLAGAATLLVAGLLLATVVRVALRPLDRMSGLARRIRDGARGRRLHPTKPNTDLGSTAAAFDAMLDALENAEAQARTAEEQMRQFLADASHDLRTPLAGVIAGAEQLLCQPTARIEREERLVRVIRQARRAARLVDDLLVMTRLDTAARSRAVEREAQRQLVEPADLVEREVELLRLRWPDLVVTVVDRPPVLVLADPDQLQRALGNLLENAAAASAPGGKVLVSSSFTDPLLTVRVIDSGPGIAAQDSERIFDRFVRLSSSRQGEGSGLGLPISRAIARAQGGDLRCVPWPGGACFELLLPALTRSERSEVVPRFLSV
jgi:two-component system OmpR family sensor kinase